MPLPGFDSEALRNHVVPHSECQFFDADAHQGDNLQQILTRVLH